MNEPASFVHGTVGEKCLGDEKYDFPPYMPRKDQLFVWHPNSLNYKLTVEGLLSVDVIDGYG